MYMPYLMGGYALALLVLLAGLHAGTRAIPGLRGVRLLTWALGLGLLGVMLLALRSVAPAWVTILLANEALFVSALLIYCATAEVLATRATFLPWGVGLIAAALVGNAYYTYLHNELAARILLDSGVSALFAASTALILFRYRDPDAQRDAPASTLRAMTWALGWLQLAVAIQDVVRCVFTVLHPPASFMYLGLIQAGYTYTNMILSLGGICGLVWLAFSMQRLDLQTMAHTDSLTGLLNRRAFEEVLARELHRTNHDGRSHGVLLLDIDHFKAVNDSWGHPVGDEVIRRVGSALQSGMRPGDTLSRFGGEEFLMLLREASIAQAEEIAWRLCAKIAGLSDLPCGVRVTASIGVAATRVDDTVVELLSRCDQALYASKRGGRNLVTVEGALPGPVLRQPLPKAGISWSRPCDS